MIQRKVAHGLMLLLATALLIPACILPAAGAEPALSPVPGAVETIIAQTAAAARTQTAQVWTPTSTVTATPTSSKTPTQTPSPTATVLFLFPTRTPVVLPTFTTFVLSVGGSSGSGNTKPTRTPKPNEHDYEGSLRCSLVGQSPGNGTVFSPRKAFTAVWTVKNTGTAAWKKHTIDYRYIAGDLFSKRKLYDMNFVVDPGETVEMKVEMNAPKNPGTYETTWAVGLNKGSMCTMTLTIVVK